MTRLLPLLLGLVASAVAGVVHALPDDRNQPIHINADKALRDEVEGVTIYSGNVELVQGSMELDADKLTIYHNTDVADEIIAEGRPAKMRQRPELDKGIVHAHARVITYFKNEDRVHLQTDARIEQEGSVVEGDAIDYFIAKQVITAESDQSREDARVNVVIPPSVHNPPESETAEEATPEEPAALETTAPDESTGAEAASTTGTVELEGTQTLVEGEEGLSGAATSE